MPSTIIDRTLALAGVFQAAYLVQQIARTGKLEDPAAFEANIKSIFNRDAENTEAVYGGKEAVRLGLASLRAQLAKQNPVRDLELTKYVLGVMHLERQLAKRENMLENIAETIERARAQVQYFSLTHTNVIASLAGIYSDTISTLTPRIMVNGDPQHLANPDNANKIRALLLAAIRSAVLWRQCGGGRLKLLFERAAMLRAIDTLL